MENDNISAEIIDGCLYVNGENLGAITEWKVGTPSTAERLLDYCVDAYPPICKGDYIFAVNNTVIDALGDGLLVMDAPNDRMRMVYSHDELRAMINMENL